MKHGRLIKSNIFKMEIKTCTHIELNAMPSAKLYSLIWDVTSCQQIYCFKSQPSLTCAHIKTNFENTQKKRHENVNLATISYKDFSFESLSQIYFCTPQSVHIQNEIHLRYLVYKKAGSWPLSARNLNEKKNMSPSVENVHNLY